jgi:hypothetical protein
LYETGGSGFYQYLMTVSYFCSSYSYNISIYGTGKLHGLDFVIIILVSSAKRTGLAEIAMVSGRSFIHNIKNKGPRMEPWGMPYLIGSHSE